MLYYRIRHYINYNFEYVRYNGFYEEMKLFTKEIQKLTIEIKSDRILNNNIKSAILILYDTINPFLEKNLLKIEKDLLIFNQYKKLGRENKKNITEEMYRTIIKENEILKEFNEIMKEKIEIVYSLYLQFRKLLKMEN